MSLNIVEGSNFTATMEDEFGDLYPLQLNTIFKDVGLYQVKITLDNNSTFTSIEMVDDWGDVVKAPKINTTNNIAEFTNITISNSSDYFLSFTVTDNTPTPEPEPEPEPIKYGSLEIIEGSNFIATITNTETFVSVPLLLLEKFNGNGVYDIQIQLNEYFYFLSIELLDEWSLPVQVATIDSENNTATFSNVVMNDYSKFIISFVATEIQPPSNVAGFNKLYLVDNDNMILLTKERFVYEGGDINRGEVMDLATYMINIFELPFTLNVDILGNETQIRLGNDLLETRGVLLTTDEMNVNLGSIYVPHKYNNSYDFIDTTIRLFLPYNQTIELEPEYVVGHTISISYLIDLYFGEVTINITSTRTNKIIHTDVTKIGREIPFIRNTKDVMSRMTTGVTLQNGVDSPYIEVIRNKQFDVDNVFRNEVTLYGAINDFTGFISVDNVKLLTSATTSEKEDIISKLKQGVYIK